jgi:hypothetical protein
VNKAEAKRVALVIASRAIEDAISADGSLLDDLYRKLRYDESDGVLVEEALKAIATKLFQRAAADPPRRIVTIEDVFMAADVPIEED